MNFSIKLRQGINNIANKKAEINRTTDSPSTLSEMTNTRITTNYITDVFENTTKVPDTTTTVNLIDNLFTNTTNITSPSGFPSTSNMNSEHDNKFHTTQLTMQGLWFIVGIFVLIAIVIGLCSVLVKKTKKPKLQPSDETSDKSVQEDTSFIELDGNTERNMELGGRLLDGEPLDNLSSYHIKFEDLHEHKETAV